MAHPRNLGRARSLVTLVLTVAVVGAVYVAFQETVGVLAGGPGSEAATAVAAATLALAIFTLFLWRRTRSEAAVSARPVVTVMRRAGGEGGVALARGAGEGSMRVSLVNRGGPPGVVTAVWLADGSGRVWAESRRSVPLLSGEEFAMDVPLKAPAESIPADAVLAICARDAGGRLGQTLFAVRRRGDVLSPQSFRWRGAYPGETEDHRILPTAVLSERRQSAEYGERSLREPAFAGTTRIRAALAPGRRKAIVRASVAVAIFGYLAARAAWQLAHDPSAQWVAMLAVWLVFFSVSSLVAFLSARAEY